MENVPPTPMPRRINPDGWTLNMGYSQAVEVRADQSVLYCAGTTALEKNGELRTALDIRSQISTTLDNLERVLSAAGYGFANLVRITVYTTAMSDTLRNLDILVARLQPHDVQPAATLLGVTSLSLPELLIEIEATAIR